MLTQLVNDKFEQITSGGLISKFKGSKEKTIAFEAADEKGKKEEEPTGIKSISKYFDKLGDEVYHDVWRPYESAIYCAFTFRDSVSVIRNKFKKSKYTYEDECPSIHYYEGTAEKGYFEMANNFGFAMLSREKQGEKTNLSDVNMECIWAADTLGMRVRQYRGMKNVNLYLVDIPEKQQCAALIVNGGLDAFKAFFNSYTLNEENNFADKYNVIYVYERGNERCELPEGELPDSTWTCVSSRAELAEKLNVSVRLISYWENGRRECDFDMLIKIADLFSVSVDYLLGRKEY
jgi:transcriptional regulator with XRE-family HTH domain